MKIHNKTLTSEELVDMLKDVSEDTLISITYCNIKHSGMLFSADTGESFLTNVKFVGLKKTFNKVIFNYNTLVSDNFITIME